MEKKADENRFDLRQQFQDYGYKYTPQRQAVLDIMLEHPNLHLSTEEIYSLLKQKQPDIGMATVYRTLLLLEKIQIIRKTDIEDGFTRYELYDHKEHAHHHLICVKCGSVFDMEDDLLEELEKRIYAKMRFTVRDHNLKFYGDCENCSKTGKEKSNKS